MSDKIGFSIVIFVVWIASGLVFDTNHDHSHACPALPHSDDGSAE